MSKHPKSDTSGMRIEVRNGNVEQAIRRLKKKIMLDGVLQELRERQAFVPNHEVKKRRKAAAKSRWRKACAKRDSM